MSDDWLSEDLEPLGHVGVELTAAGIRQGTALAPWASVFGVAELPPRPRDAKPSAASKPDVIYVLVPRRPPAPPWFEIRPSDLSDELLDEGLGGLAARIRNRAARSDYRSYRRPDAMMPPATLLQRALNREELPGALEVPVAEGPGLWQRRIAASMGTGTLGGVTMLAIAAAAHLPPLMGAVGLITGALLPTGLAALNRRRKTRPRVLLLSPDGCVVGFPTGVRAFAWSEVGRFDEGRAPLPGTRRPKRPCLRVYTQDDQLAGTIDASWFDGPIGLIVAVAEAYRTRHAQPGT